MKKSLLLVACFFLAILLHAQDPYKQGRFVIQGKVKGYTEPTVDFGITTFFGDVQNSVVVKPDGTFRQTFAVQHRQHIYIRINNEVVGFTVCDGDIIKLSWDAAAFKKSFRVEGKNKLRTKELAVERAFFQQQLDAMYEMRDSLAGPNSIKDVAKHYQFLNRLYNRQVQTILDSAGTITPGINYLLTHVYFDYIRNMRRIDRANPGKYWPVLQLNKSVTYPRFSLADTIAHPALHRTLSEDWWANVPAYRRYLYDYVRFPPQAGNLFGKPDAAMSNTDATKTVTAQVTAGDDQSFRGNFALDHIWKGEKHLTVPSIREWFSTQVILDGFGSYAFADVDKAYQYIIGSYTSAYLRDTLQQFYSAMQRLHAGAPAPAFSLRDEKNKLYSLADFKGKVVYIDFWGVGCGPCIYEIKNHVPQLQKQYEGKDVVFINICVDAKGKEWTEALRKYNLGGINLYTGGWTDHPVCQDYNVNSIPRYILIDKAGNIVDNTAPSASELLQSGGRNAIEKLLN